MKKTIQTRLDRFGLSMNRKQMEKEQGIRSALNRIKEAEEKTQDQEEPYWSAGKWEDWAMRIYDDIPDARKYLPRWFIEAYEEE